MLCGNKKIMFYKVDFWHTDILQYIYLACGSSAPVRVENEVGTVAWFVGTLAAPSVQGHGLPPSQELWPYQSFFLSLL